jgi:ADP-ribose pyrophosphatase
MTNPMSSSESPKVLFEGRHVRLVKRGQWEYAERKSVTGIVGIVAVTDDGKLVLVEQYRPPVGRSVIELPAGLAGDDAAHEGEALEQAARRELLEETGYEAARMEYACAGAASAGITSEIISMYLASGLRKTGPGAGDGSEKITVHEVPLDQVHPWLQQQAGLGKVVDLKVFAGMALIRDDKETRR